MKTSRLIFTCLLGSAAVWVAGCGDAPKTGITPPGVHAAVLQQTSDCSALESNLKHDALVRMNANIDQMIEYTQAYGSPWGGVDYAEGDNAAGTSSGSGGATGGTGGGAPDHSDTNTQVEGVDEADIVKTDGNHVFLLHGQSLTVLRSWPIQDLAVERSLEIEGTPFEMFVDGSRAVVYSSVDGAGVYAAAGVTPPLADYYGGYDPYSYYYPLTKITVLDLDATTAEDEVAEHYLDGYYVTSRREGDIVRTVVSGGYYETMVQLYPTFADGDYPESDDEWIDALEALRTQNAVRIATASLEDFLPDQFTRSPDGVVSRVATSCGDVLVPTAGTTEYGATRVYSLDLATPTQPVDQKVVFGSAWQIYQNHDRLVLAAGTWQGYFGIGGWEELGSELVSMVGTHLHVFDIQNGGGLSYTGSSTVLGSVPDQFAIDEKDGVLSVATTEQLASATEWSTKNDLFTLAVSPAGVTPLGSVQDIAPGEQLYSTRFVGDKAYIVTFRQVDPLFVIDLSNPAAPTIQGELTLPGFSEYMHPIDAGHLLTIGYDADPNGAIQGLALQIFDVTNPVDPKLLAKHALADGGGWSYSEALYNHKAFTFYDGMLAIPVSGWDDQTGTPHSSLDLFDIDLATGITPMGSVDHTPYFNPTESGCYYYGYDVRRGIFIDQYLVSVSESAVVASDLGDMSTPVAVATLPELQSSCDYYYE
ncbi:MAG TPA: beta-propeller domain-containing protein [Polyangiaceae bacterium]|nr:beta-propeller domain-containing protein [Polyangiaceae bacterium]